MKDFPFAQSDPVALLVDGENLSRDHAHTLLARARALGNPTIRRVYGKAEHISGWEDAGFRLVPTRPGKNAADLLLCVEAMALALRDKVHTLLIASSDRDFSYLAEHLRELGHHVVGLGEGKTPLAFRTACSDFVELPAVAAMEAEALDPGGEPPAARLQPNKIIPKIRAVLPRTLLKDGWATAEWTEAQLRAEHPEFRAQSYGYATLESLIEAVKFFEVRRNPDGKFCLREPVRDAAPSHTAP